MIFGWLVDESTVQNKRWRVMRSKNVDVQDQHPCNPTSRNRTIIRRKAGDECVGSQLWTSRSGL